jgi:Xaa-Pro aminopeptidase
MSEGQATIMGGIPAHNMGLFHRIRFMVGDPVAVVELPDGQYAGRTLILRDIEMGRARQSARADQVACPADFAPESGLSGDRETATAQAAAELLRRANVSRVTADRSLPLIYVDQLRRAKIDVNYDPEIGVTDRRAKDEGEIAHLQEAQQATEAAMEMACRLVAGASPDRLGTLQHEGSPLTSERVRAAIDVWLLQHGYANPNSIVAGGPQGADCHELGSGPLRTGEPVIIDIFPQNRRTYYNGDCTRTVVHGEISDQLKSMHQAVVAAKRAATETLRAGVIGEQVHRATLKMIEQHGFEVGLPDESTPDSYCAIVHGTGHGVGLEVHEPPLLDFNGPPLIAGDAVTIEPGLYCKAIGGIRVEDLLIVEEGGSKNLNQLPEGLVWN